MNNRLEENALETSDAMLDTEEDLMVKISENAV